MAKSIRNIIPILVAELEPYESIENKFPDHILLQARLFYAFPRFSVGSRKGLDRTAQERLQGDVHKAQDLCGSIEWRIGKSKI